MLVRNVGDRASKLLCKTTEPFRPHGGAEWGEPMENEYTAGTVYIYICI